MNLTAEQLEQIAGWSAVGEFANCDPISDHITPAVTRLQQFQRWRCCIPDWERSNYYSLALTPSIVWNDTAPHSEKHAIFIYLSRMVPIAAIGITKATGVSNCWGASPLQIDSIVDPTHGSDFLIDAALDSFAETIYEFAPRAFLLELTPVHIEPDCRYGCDERWERVFDILFANCPSNWDNVTKQDAR